MSKRTISKCAIGVDGVGKISQKGAETNTSVDGGVQLIDSRIASGCVELHQANVRAVYEQRKVSFVSE